MPWTHVQSNGTGAAPTATSIAQAFGANVTAGSFIAVAVFWGSTTATCTVSDGTAYTAVGSPTTNATQVERGQIFYLPNSGGGATTVTATFSVSVINRVIFIGEYTGILTASPLDGTAFNGSTGSSTAPATPITTLTANDLVFGATYVDQTASPGAGFTGRVNALGNQSEDKNQAAAGAVSVAFTQSPTGGWTALGAAFKETVAGVVTPRMLGTLGVGT